MKPKDIKDKNKDDLLNLLKTKRDDLHNFRFGIAGSKKRNVKEGKSIRKDIARILTILNSSIKNK